MKVGASKGNLAQFRKVERGTCSRLKPSLPSVYVVEANGNTDGVSRLSSSMRSVSRPLTNIESFGISKYTESITSPARAESGRFQVSMRRYDWEANPPSSPTRRLVPSFRTPTPAYVSRSAACGGGWSPR